MRKKTILLSMLLPLAALIAACSGQEDITAEQPPQLPETQLRPMTFRAGESQAQTRADETPITKNMYPLYLCGKHVVEDNETEVTANIPNNTRLVWQGGVGVSGKYVAPECYWPKEGKMKFFAYSSSTKDGTYGIKAAQNQSGNWELEFPNCCINGTDNIMYALPGETDCTKLEEPELHFKHTTHRIVMALTDQGKTKNSDGQDIELKIKTIYIEGIHWGGKLIVSEEGSYAWEFEDKIDTKEIKVDGTLKRDELSNNDDVITVLYIPTGQYLKKFKLIYVEVDPDNLSESEDKMFYCNLSGAGLEMKGLNSTMVLDSKFIVNALSDAQQTGVTIKQP